jgi:hypothetical protein
MLLHVTWFRIPYIARALKVPSRLNEDPRHHKQSSTDSLTCMITVFRRKVDKAAP